MIVLNIVFPPLIDTDQILRISLFLDDKLLIKDFSNTFEALTAEILLIFFRLTLFYLKDHLILSYLYLLTSSMNT